MPVTRYVYAGAGHLVGEDRNGTGSIYRHDAMGSTTQLVNTTGAITDTFSFDFYGNSLGRTGSTATPMQWRAMAGTYSPQGGPTFDLILPRSLPWSGILKPVPYDPIPGIPIVGPPPGWFPIVPPFFGPWHPEVVVHGGGSGGGPGGAPGGGGGPSFGGGPVPGGAPPSGGGPSCACVEPNPRTPSGAGGGKVDSCNIPGVVGACIAAMCSALMSYKLYKSLGLVGRLANDDVPDNWWDWVKTFNSAKGCAQRAVSQAQGHNPVDDCCKAAYYGTGSWISPDMWLMTQGIGRVCKSKYINVPPPSWRDCARDHPKDSEACEKCCREHEPPFDAGDLDHCLNERGGCAEVAP